MSAAGEARRPLTIVEFREFKEHLKRILPEMRWPAQSARILAGLQAYLPKPGTAAPERHSDSWYAVHLRAAVNATQAALDRGDGAAVAARTLQVGKLVGEWPAARKWKKYRRQKQDAGRKGGSTPSATVYRWVVLLLQCERISLPSLYPPSPRCKPGQRCEKCSTLIDAILDMESRPATLTRERLETFKYDALELFQAMLEDKLAEPKATTNNRESEVTMATPNTTDTPDAPPDLAMAIRAYRAGESARDATSKASPNPYRPNKVYKADERPDDPPDLATAIRAARK